MSTLTIDLITSLDGFATAEGWPGYWGKQTPEYLAWLAEDLAQDHVLVMGAGTYRTMVQVMAEEEDASFARLAELAKVVFSSTLQEPLDWPNTRLVAEDAVPAVRRMKAEESLPLRTIGSLSLNGPWLREGLVDRVRLVVFPVVTGRTGQERTFRDWPDLDLQLVDARTFEGGLQLLEYVPTLH